jgi:hypothetical protein
VNPKEARDMASQLATTCPNCGSAVVLMLAGFSGDELVNFSEILEALRKQMREAGIWYELHPVERVEEELR